MEESHEVRSEENKAIPEKNKKRRLKTSTQLEALEKFYNEHKYPTEPMKLQLAETLELTEKQISGWFCHRRLKDKKLLTGEAYANGRQDRSSGVVQDRGSGHRQDSCGSTKQGDLRHFDPKEVESQRFSGQDFTAEEITYDTSSGSSSPLENKFFPRSEDPIFVPPPTYVTQYKDIPVDVKNVKMRNRPSGYLKVKGQVENAAIIAVKRQLGSQYREDGPQLGIEFQPLPPGAFESSTRDVVNEPYYAGDPSLPSSPDVPKTRKQPNPGMKYVHKSNLSSYESDFDGTSSKNMHGSDRHENYSRPQFEKKSSLPIHSNPFPGRSSALKMKENSTGENLVYDSRRHYGIVANHSFEGMRLDSGSSNHVRPFGRKLSTEQMEPWLRTYDGDGDGDGDDGDGDGDGDDDGDDDDGTHKGQKEIFESEPVNLKLKRGESLVKEDRRMSRRMDQEDKLYGERRVVKEYSEPVRLKIHPTDEIRVAKRVRDEFPQQQYPRKESSAEMPAWTNQIKRSAAEIPSSFSEDETAETSSSVD